MEESIEKIVKENKGTVVDVRTAGEFSTGSVAGALNFPLHEIPQNIEELKKLEAPLILCCVSGIRSGKAAAYLSLQGIDCLNGGSWLEINYLTLEEV